MYIPISLIVMLGVLYLMVQSKSFEKAVAYTLLVISPFAVAGALWVLGKHAVYLINQSYEPTVVEKVEKVETVKPWEKEWSTKEVK